MLTEIYIESLVVDEELADQVWEAWDKGEIDDLVAWLACGCLHWTTGNLVNPLLRLSNTDKSKNSEQGH